jgi:hypothetical protein
MKRLKILLRNLAWKTKKYTKKSKEIDNELEK